MHKKFGKDRACSSRHILSDRQTDRHTDTQRDRRTHHNTLQPLSPTVSSDGLASSRAMCWRASLYCSLTLLSWSRVLSSAIRLLSSSVSTTRICAASDSISSQRHCSSSATQTHRHQSITDSHRY